MNSHIENMDINDLFIDQNFLNILNELPSLQKVKETQNYNTSVFVMYELVQELQVRGFVDVSQFISHKTEISYFIFKIRELLKSTN